MAKLEEKDFGDNSVWDYSFFSSYKKSYSYLLREKPPAGKRVHMWMPLECYDSKRGGIDFAAGEAITCSGIPFAQMRNFQRTKRC